MLCGTLFGCTEVLYMHVTQIGLIDPDDPTEEDRRVTCGQKQHKLHGQSIGLTDTIY